MSKSVAESDNIGQSRSGDRLFSIEHNRMEEEVSQDEGVVRDILEELDKERAKRAELEAKVRKLERQIEVKKENENQAISRHSYIEMESRVSAYLDIVEALTSNRPAISEAAKSKSAGGRSLPLHVIRLLETIPWDPRSHEYVFGEEQVFEWQAFDPRERMWQSQLKHLPPFFKSLPRTRFGEKDNDDRTFLLFLAGGAENRAGSGRVVLTDELLSRCLDGVPELPKDGATWDWVSGWRVKQKVVNHLSGKSFDSDRDGWSYVALPQYFLLGTTDKVYSDASATASNQRGIVERKLRRRCWSRQRILVEYPHICESTRHYLAALAENAKLKVASSKVSDQLVRTKVALTETEEKLLLEQEKVHTREGTTLGGEHPCGGSVNGKSSIDVLKEGHNNQVKQIGSKISSWVSSKKIATKAGSFRRSREESEDRSHDCSNGKIAVLSENLPARKVSFSEMMEESGDYVASSNETGSHRRSLTS